MKKTLRKTDKLKLKSDFEYVRRNGIKYVSRGFLTVVAPSEEETSLRCGVICSRKYSLLAVQRNRARRILYESFRLLKSNIKPCQIILIPRANLKCYKQQEVQKELIKSLKQAKVFQHLDC